MNSMAIKTFYDPVEVVRAIYARHPIWFNTALGFTALMAFCLLMMSVDERLLTHQG